MTRKIDKIAMIGQKRVPSREGGVEVVVTQLAVRMAKLGYHVDLYNRWGYHVSGRKFTDESGIIYPEIRILKIPTFRNGKLNAIVYTVLGTFRALFGGYDVIHYHAEGPCIMLWLPKMLGIRVVATIHGLDWQRAKWGNFASKVLKAGEKTAAKYADEIIVLSENVRKYFEETYGRKVNFVPNGIEKPVLRETYQIHKRWQLEKDSYILFLARIVPEKGLHYLIQAYNELNTDKKLVIAGGNSNAQEYMEEIKSVADKNKNIIMTDFVQGPVLEELLSNAYLFVLPSDIEGMAISLLEAMSYGNCCLVSDIDENLEVVEDKAVSFKKGDVQNLKLQMEKLLKEPDLVYSYKEQASDFITQKYNWEQVVEETLNLYRKPEKK